MQIHLLRHGESVWNAEHRWQGHGNPALTPVGREQARLAGLRLASAGIECIIASDLLRARQTAEIVGRLLGIPPELDERWRERAIGQWTGLTREQIESRFPDDYARFHGRNEHARPGGGESNAMLRERAHAALAALRERHAGRRVLVVTHRGIARMLAPDSPLANAESCLLQG